MNQILIVRNLYLDAITEEQLEYIAQQNSSRIQLFDCTEFSVNEFLQNENQKSLSSLQTSKKKNEGRSSVYNINLNDQLATALIQDTDFNSQADQVESQQTNLPFHENIHRNQILWHSFQEYFLQNEFDAVVFLTIPEGLNESILYLVAKTLSIDVLILFQSPVSNQFFSFRSLQDCGNYDKHAEIKTDFRHSNEEVAAKRKHKHSQRNYQGFSFSGILKVCTFLFKARSPNLLNPIYILRHAQHLHDAPANSAYWKDPYAKFFYCRSTAYFEFFSSNHTGKVDLHQKYVYFPIQSVTELHPEILISQFGDQLLALERLASILPQNFKIFVKSNPDQYPDYLTPMFFHRIKRIGNVVRLPSCFDSEQLISHSEFVATVSSRDGWEALSQGTKVLIFGNPWYRNLPGAHTYTETFEYTEIVNSQFDHSEFEHQINCLFDQSHTGSLVLKKDLSITENETCENAQQIANTIFDLVFGRINPTFYSSST